ncbi:hypothetical protein NOR_05872 [Metarhizium rileyi]|uniref:Uncharacterized protein n=1 Tax=Metarhizium rileyi (strain RCEF 4871) TaxID=1649241 RepID=A0A167BQT5_METRR|nr:hypothetical protein NOR_05872 [Metarhizium rileyi RCEF 4871]
MVLSTFPQEDAEFHEVETVQGNIMVSADLLSMSGSAVEETPGLSPRQTHDLDNIISLPSTAIPRPLVPEYLADPVRTQLLPSNYSKPYVTTPESSPPTESNEPCSVDPEPYATDALHPGQLHNEIYLPQSPPFAACGQVLSVLPNTINGTGPLTAPTSGTPLPPTPGATPAGHESNHGATSADGTSHEIPSYMTPQAIRARNLILSCHLPPKPVRNASASSERTSFPESPRSSKRQRLEGSEWEFQPGFPGVNG